MAMDRFFNRVLLTGAAGTIGRSLRTGIARAGETLRLTDVKEIAVEAENEEVLIGDLSNPDFAAKACKDVDAIVHMAGHPKEKPWEVLVGPNINAAITLWEAARTAGVRRIVYGSSNHVVGFYRTDVRLDGAMPPRPDSRYGVTKLFGEGLASLYADKYGISAFCIRIGTFRDAPTSTRELSTWISPRDLAALTRIGIDADIVFETVFGVSGNSRSWCDNSRAFALGYRPQDDAETFAEQISPEDAKTNGVAGRVQGGGSAAMEYAGRLSSLPGRPRQ